MFDKDSITLLRIPFSYFLLPVYLFAISQCHQVNISNMLVSFIVPHLFIYPASNGYNSYMDRDEGSIGGLEHPPPPTIKLFYLTLLFDIMGLLLSLAVSFWFTLGLILYILASRAYSFK